MTFNNQIKTVFAGFRPSTQFMTLNGYKNSHGEVSDYNLLWNISYEQCVKKALNTIKNLDMGSVPLKGFTFDDLKVAGIELLNSFQETLTLGPGNNTLYTNKETYDAVYDATGQVIKGLILHKNDNTLHMTGVYRMKKVVKVPGIYKQINSRPKTIAKNTLRNMTALAKWGQFKLEPGNFISLVADKHTIEFDNI